MGDSPPLTQPRQADTVDTVKKLTVTRAVEIVDPEATGAAMRKRREDAGVSLREMGRRLGVSAAYLSDLELGRRAWTEERAQNYAKAIAGK